MTRAVRVLTLCALALLSQGCFGVRYVTQAAGGQLGIMRAARPLSSAMRDPATDPAVRRLLLHVPRVKEFGREHGLHATASYTRYAELHRPAAVWVVQACAPLSFDVHHWRMPVVGSVPYLGWFDRAAADRYATELSQRGLDVDVRPASAYSTLGWFSDPILSTMIRRGDAAIGDLANVVLHESVHATLYVDGQSTFNESLATFVADRLTDRWLSTAFGPAAPETLAWRALQARRASRAGRLRATWTALEAVYASTAEEDVKRADKARILEAAERELALDYRLNNASLAGYRTYAAGTGAFERLLSASGGSFPRFLAALKTVRPEDFGSAQREDFDALLNALAARLSAPPATRARGR